MESYEILWKTVLPELEKSNSSIYYSTFITPIKPVDIVGNKIVLIVPGQILLNAISGERVSASIREALKKCSTEIDDFVVYDAKDRDEYLKIIEEEGTDDLEGQGSPINPKFTFDSFVVGPSNEFIYAAAKAVADHPGKTDEYNPLFIYGGTGLGKTHILMAIANYIKLHSPNTKVLYSTCEQFTNQMVDAVSRGKISPQDFRRKYRSVDVLLIDDVQFLAKRQGTQTEFFNTFNELVMQGKQIVLTSDRPPKEIDVLEDRLRTRFEGGLLADIQPPDLETRIAILRKKSEEQKCLVSIDVLTYIAETFEGDLRSLIGKLTKVIFASKLHERPITIELVKDALRESAGEKQEDLQIDDIINCVADFYNIDKAEIIGKKKNKEFAEPRQICMYLITEMMSLPLVTVGEKLGGRNHATVIYARDKIVEQMKTDSKLATEIRDIQKKLLKE